MEVPNLSYIYDLPGDEDFRSNLKELLKEELTDDINNYEDLKERNNPIELANIVHKLKHKISILGMNNSLKISNDYENNLRKKSYVYQQEFELILEKLKEFTNQI